MVNRKEPEPRFVISTPVLGVNLISAPVLGGNLISAPVLGGNLILAPILGGNLISAHQLLAPAPAPQHWLYLFSILAYFCLLFNHYQLTYFDTIE